MCITMLFLENNIRSYLLQNACVLQANLPPRYNEVLNKSDCLTVLCTNEIRSQTPFFYIGNIHGLHFIMKFETYYNEFYQTK